MTPRSTCVLYETDGRWAVALRKAAADLPIRETRSPERWLVHFRESPASILAVAAPDGCDAVRFARLLEASAQLQRKFPDMCLVVLLTEADRSLATAAYEAGAAWVQVGRWRLDPLVRLVRRRQAMFPDLPAETPIESIWRKLPWADPPE
ncbi:hypothetical protein LOC68_24410 [Blastopirellula sp. JC732]|uniref:Uncharacterized protein n=1 Tax=Blastopirellula sediminis TaxID=2894196 RepID=A0A9X1MT08_9BACT|nr:hypothetical protein [Blastopirellula sediminis]MCC9605148.1 hypothetical protein [Blastopirellula sediminis]MCC9631552.1 hypothetical protein [Blastopirellula sediminis]